jgi:hypothetical protein
MGEEKLIMTNDFLQMFLAGRRDRMNQDQFNKELQLRLDSLAQEMGFKERSLQENSRQFESNQSLDRDRMKQNYDYMNSQLNLGMQNSRREAIGMINTGQADPGTVKSSVPTGVPGMAPYEVSGTAPNAVDLGGGVLGVPNSPERIAQRQADSKIDQNKAVAQAEIEQKREFYRSLWPDDHKKQLRAMIYGLENMDPKDLEGALIRGLSEEGKLSPDNILKVMKAVAGSQRSPGQEASAFASANLANAQVENVREIANDRKNTSKAQEILNEGYATLLPTVGHDKNDKTLPGKIAVWLNMKMKDGTLNPQVAAKANDLLNMEQQRSSSGNFMEQFMMQQMMKK